MDKGYVQVYTGNGKGKTTAAIGLCVRALGSGLSVYFGQFIKSMRYSEIGALEKLGAALAEGPGASSERIALRQFGRGCFIGRDPEPDDKAAAEGGLTEAKAALISGRYDLVVLDELSVAASIGLVGEKDVLDLIAAKPDEVELVITGRYATEAIVAAADLVTECREVRHYYAKGVQARDGIER